MKPLLQALAGIDSHISARMGGLQVQLQPIPGEVEVVQVTIEARDELPIYITGAPGHILCICYLWDEAEVRPASRTAMHEAMLDLNPAIPLSSFGRIGSRYVLTGALGRDARVSEIAEDIAALSDNARDALEALQDYLN
jgi:uncharacterized protein